MREGPNAGRRRLVSRRLPDDCRLREGRDLPGVQDLHQRRPDSTVRWVWLLSLILIATDPRRSRAKESSAPPAQRLLPIAGLHRPVGFLPHPPPPRPRPPPHPRPPPL